jgi:hypothetical protein
MNAFPASLGVAYDVTGISPQSNTRAQELNGFVAKGTLYPPLPSSVRKPPARRPTMWSHTIDSDASNPGGSPRDRSGRRGGRMCQYRMAHPGMQCRSFPRRRIDTGSRGGGQRSRCPRTRSRPGYRRRPGACCTIAALCEVLARRGRLVGRRGAHGRVLG